MTKNSAAIYIAGLFQGIALVAFPASSTILTNPHAFGFTSTEYGSLFIPQALFSILMALFNPMLCNRFSAQKVFTVGLIANLISMILLTSSAAAMNHH